MDTTSAKRKQRAFPQKEAAVSRGQQLLSASLWLTSRASSPVFYEGKRCAQEVVSNNHGDVYWSNR